MTGRTVTVTPSRAPTVTAASDCSESDARRSAACGCIMIDHPGPAASRGGRPGLQAQAGRGGGLQRRAGGAVAAGTRVAGRPRRDGANVPAGPGRDPPPGGRPGSRWSRVAAHPPAGRCLPGPSTVPCSLRAATAVTGFRGLPTLPTLLPQTVSVGPLQQ